MKQVTTATTNQWLSGDYVGPNRPVQRATIQVPHLYPTRYQVTTATTVTFEHEGVGRSLNFNQDGPIREFPVSDVHWTRDLTQDVATCVIKIDNENWNSQNISEMGWYTANHGTESFDAQWSQVTNQWADWFVPDRLIRTYEGYGTDGNLDPALDTHLYPSGVWLVDSVDLDLAGNLTLNCRDAGRLLLEQFAYPPVVPETVYPLHFENRSTQPAPSTAVALTWTQGTWYNDSNQVYAAAGTYKDGPDAACTATGYVRGHGRGDALAALPTTWMSVGSAQPDWSYWEFTPAGGTATIGSVQLSYYRGPVTVYVSVLQGGLWVGHKKIPYQQNKDTPALAANINYVGVKSGTATGSTLTIPFARPVTNVTRVRITVVSKWKSWAGKTRKYKGTLSSVQYHGSTASTTAGVGTVPTGNITDWSHVVRWVALWAGFHWPSGAHTSTLTSKPAATAPPSDPILPVGSIWGDVRDCGAAPMTKLLQNNFDQKPLADAVNFARESVGFNFYVDEWGGLIWRLPNQFTAGNYLAPTSGGQYTRTTNYVTINDNQTLIDLTTTTSSADVREQFFVADLQGRFGATVAGYNPAPAGINRLAGWTDYEFASADEALRTADLMAIRSFYKYRQCKVTIAANPALQIDDQIVLFERITGDGYRHRITAIDSTWNVDEGKWVYILTTEWMGDAAFTSLPWDVNNLSAPTQAYLHALGAV